MAGNKVEIQIIGDPSSALRSFKQVSAESESFGSKVTHGLGTITKAAGLAAGVAGLGALAVTLKAGYGEWMQSAKVSAQTEAVIKSTGGEANVTAKHVDELSGALLKKSGVDDEAIKSGANMLLTFTNIKNEVGKGNDVFDQTTKTLLDMSVATGQDMPKAAVMLGKAINDPITGISALHRVGVTFTDGQKESISAMVKSGDTMGAQKVILQELQKEFGGSAEAAGKTLPGQLSILREEFANVAGDVVGKLVPALQTVVEWVTAHWDQISAVMNAVFTAIAYAIENGIKPALQELILGVQIAIAYVRDHWTEIQNTFEQVWATIAPIIALTVAAFKLVADTVQEHWPFIQRNLEAVRDVVEDSLKIVRSALRLVVDLIHGDWSKAWDDVKDIVSNAIKLVSTVVSNEVENIKGYALAIGKAMLSGVEAGASGLLGWAGDLVTGIEKAITGGISSVMNAAENFAGGIVDGVVSGIKGLAGELTHYITAPINAIIDKWNSISFKTPSVHVPFGPTIGGETIGVPQIPRLDVGGTVLESGVAIVHRGEVVLPASGRLAGAGRAPITLELHVGTLIGGRPEQVVAELFPAIRKALAELQRANVSTGIA